MRFVLDGSAADATAVAVVGVVVVVVGDDTVIICILPSLTGWLGLDKNETGLARMKF